MAPSKDEGDETVGSPLAKGGAAARPAAGAGVDKPGDDMARAARSVVRSALTGSLASLQAGTGHPYASLVTVAFTPTGAPILLLSNLALHTRNLSGDPRASLLVDGTSGTGDPLAGDRATLIGRIEKITEPEQAAAMGRRFLARHPAAQMYAGFADFAFYALAVDSCHFIGGFGRIHTVPFATMAVDTSGAAQLLEAEADIVQHMNDDHADAVRLYAEVLGGHCASDGPWRMTGLDPCGLDIAGSRRGVRLEFPTPVATAEEARRALIALVSEARRAG